MGDPPDRGKSNDDLISFESKQVLLHESLSEGNLQSNSSSLCEVIKNWTLDDPTCFDINTPEPTENIELKKHRRRALSVPKNNSVDYKSLYEELRRDFAAQEENFQKKIIKLTTDYEILKEDFEKRIHHLESEIHVKDTEINRLSDEKVSLKNKNSLLNQKLTNLKDDEEQLLRRLKCQGDIIVNMKKKNESNNAKLIAENKIQGKDNLENGSFVENLVKRISDNLEAKIDTMIEKKLSDNLGESAKPVNENNVSNYKQALISTPLDFKNIMKEAKNDEKIEQKEVDRRSTNFVIHGADEIGDTPASIKENDETYVIEILTQVKISERPKAIRRLGKKMNGKTRPILIEMNSQDQKNELMANLKYLKGTTEYFGSIRITDDYTKDERELIKDFVAKANEKNRNDPNNVYRVRGNPKNGLFLIHFPRK